MYTSQHCALHPDINNSMWVNWYPYIAFSVWRQTRVYQTGKSISRCILETTFQPKKSVLPMRLPFNMNLLARCSMRWLCWSPLPCYLTLALFICKPIMRQMWNRSALELLKYSTQSLQLVNVGIHLQSFLQCVDMTFQCQWNCSTR